jgi:hypothetical protein
MNLILSSFKYIYMANNKIQFDLVQIEAEKILFRLLGAKNDSESDKIYKEYLSYLDACGWTDAEYDSETLKRVDKNWELNNEPQNTKQSN